MILVWKPEVFTPSVYGCTEASEGREGNQEQRARGGKLGEKKESLMGGMKGLKRRPCRTTLAPLTPP